MKLEEIGKIIAGILIFIILFQFLFTYNKYCRDIQDENFDIGICLEKLNFLLIPMEANIIEFLESLPILTVIVLFYIRNISLPI